MSMNLRNTPISCRVCQSIVHGKEYTVVESTGRRVTNCVWRCSHCGTQNKQGITNIIEPIK